MINSRDIRDLHPYVRTLAERHIGLCKSEGINIIITSTKRDDAYQAKLYAQGRTEPGSIVTNSKVVGPHGFGLAYDVVPIDAVGNPVWNSQTLWDKIGRIGKSLRLEWGGDWKSFVDKPHFQLTEGLTTTQLRAGNRPSFWDYVLITDPIKESIPDWKLEGLKGLHAAGIVQDFEGWKTKLDEPLPAWAAFAIMNKILKEAQK